MTESRIQLPTYNKNVQRGMEAILDTFTDKQATPLIHMLNRFGLVLPTEQKLRVCGAPEFIYGHTEIEPEKMGEYLALAGNAARVGLLRTAETFYYLAGQDKKAHEIHQQRQLPQLPIATLFMLRANGFYEKLDYLGIGAHLAKDSRTHGLRLAAEIVTKISKPEITQ